MDVCVTGATGFVASRIVEALLARGHRVRGTVRRLDGEAARRLRTLPGADRLELVAADLLQAGAFGPAVEGMESVIHTASPYSINVIDPASALVEPAVAGTRRVLEAAAAVPGVKRVVVTSSMAAITDEPDESHVLTEADWNTKSSITRNPYYFSKTLAEKEAWTFVERERPAWDLVVINPFMVIGPSLVPSLNLSNKILVDLLAGAYPGVMNLAWGIVDVRDVALAHVAAMDKPEARGRYICANETVTMRELVGHGVRAWLRRGGEAADDVPRLRHRQSNRPRGVLRAVARGRDVSSHPRGPGSALRQPEDPRGARRHLPSGQIDGGRHAGGFEALGPPAGARRLTADTASVDDDRVRRLTALVLAILIAVSVPAWPGTADRPTSPTTSDGGFASGRSSDASFTAPEATVASQSSSQTRPAQTLLGPQFSSLAPDVEHSCLVVAARLHSAASRPSRSYPLLI